MSRGKQVLGYTRGDRGASLEAQRAAIAAHCAKRGWVLVRLEEDKAGGGKRSRPALARALEAVRSGGAEGLVVARLDRLAGSLSEAARLLERARGEGWNLIALDLELDPSTAAGRRLGEAFLTAAEWERRLRSERAREALERRRAQGGMLGTPRRAPPPIVDKIKRRRAEGLSLQVIADELNRLRIPTARGGSSWRPSSVRSVLTRVS
jgi:DNA invertase Pin-like site-specific DNA recombinase